MYSYILDEGNNPVVCDVLEFAKWMGQNSDRLRVLEDHIEEYRISTVFLGINHNYGEGPPLLFETMVFQEEGDSLYCVRAATWEEAERQHLKAIEWVHKGSL